MTPSQQLKHYRAQLGLSQSQLAKKYDVEVSNIQKWEQGINTGSPLLRLFLKNLEKDLTTIS